MGKNSLSSATWPHRIQLLAIVKVSCTNTSRDGPELRGELSRPFSGNLSVAEVTMRQARSTGTSPLSLPSRGSRASSGVIAKLARAIVHWYPRFLSLVGNRIQGRG